MNWLDIVFLFILIYNLTKGLRLGFVLSIFNIVQIILSVLITKRYYPVVYAYIINSPKIYNLFKGLTEWLLKILFFSRDRNGFNIIPNLFSQGLLKLIISIFAIIIIFSLANILASTVLGAFSFLLNVPVLKQLNKIGGMLFGLMEGLFIVYLLNMVLYSVAAVFPKSFIGKSIDGSIFCDYFRDLNFILDFINVNDYL
ncbi:MAG: CvpA family protein [Tissierellia bacterium]|nr:CvpA family protein [Tissierellia bacterium]